MKRKIYQASMLLFFIGASLSSCTTIKKSAQGVNFNPTDDITPVQVAIEVDSDKKITGKSKSVYLLNMPFLRFGQKEFTDGGYRGIYSKTKGAATYNAVKSSGADVVVNPQFELKRTNGLLWLWSTIEVNVTGFKGTYVIKN